MPGDRRAGAAEHVNAAAGLLGAGVPGCLDIVLVWSPDRLARKFAYQDRQRERAVRCPVRLPVRPQDPRPCKLLYNYKNVQLDQDWGLTVAS